MRAFLRNTYLNIIGTIKKPKPGVHIINSHFVKPKVVDLVRDTKVFEDYLQYLNQFAKFITLQEATKRILDNNIPDDEVLITFSFDDGFEECYTIIAPILEKYNTKGAFFINANYIESNDAYQREFHKRVSSSTKFPMSWLQVEDLHGRGHLIGSHNLDHTNFASLTTNEIEFQLQENNNILEERLNYHCEYFAWTYGQLQNFPESLLNMTLKYHTYIYSGTNYKNYFSYNGKVINRRHQEPFWPFSHIRYFIANNKIYNAPVR